ncbi:peptidase inhibitor family I36 protein [Streptomyces sp. NPDC102274]|uniref:peptidase inhibitor family I36 protein n=1 Tax=Streptomyces sp. NPDC102274 TaxID=3366151 RepID=UPI0037FF976D
MIRISLTRKKIIATVVTAVAGATLGLVTMGQASAVEQTCGGSGSGLMCVYSDAYFQGAVVQTGTNSHPQAMNDVISSIANNTDTRMCYWVDADYQGSGIMLAPGQAAYNLALQLPDYNDKISSYAPC